MPFYQRKHLRLEDYSYSSPGVYFITVCTQDKHCILSTIVGADAHIGPPSGTTPVGADAHIGPYPRLTPIGTVVEKYLRNIPGVGHYVIMPNHVHLLLHISAANPSEGPVWSWAPNNVHVPQLIRSWKTMVTKELGHSIWQRSYYDHIIRDEADYQCRVRYIAENPAKWYYDDYYVP